MATMMNYLKRRFSSGDLQNEYDENVMSIPTSADAQVRMATQDHLSRQPAWQAKSSSYTSAPSSPTRSVSFANQFINVARGVVNQAIQQIPHQPTGGPAATPSSSSHPYPYQQQAHPQSLQHREQHQQISKEKCKILLVIDDQHTDW